MSTEEEVLQASEQFYAALDRFLNGDSKPMMEVWSHGLDVTAMHSAPGRQVGWEEVRAAWEQFASLTSDGQVTVHDLLVRVGSDLAYTVGASATQPTFRQWSRTEIPGSPSGVVLAQKRNDVTVCSQRILSDIMFNRRLASSLIVTGIRESLGGNRFLVG